MGVAQISAAASGVDVDTEKTVVARTNFDVHFLTPQVIKQQQSIADTFAKIGLLPQPITIDANVWTPPSGRVADAVSARRRRGAGRQAQEFGRS